MYRLRTYLYLILLCLFLYGAGLAEMPLLDRDEPHFAQASRQMAQTHDYQRIRFQDQPRHLKPPGIYWLQSAAVRLFSAPESNAVWPYRLPSVLGAIFAVCLTFYAGGRLAAVLLACSVLLIIEAHLAVTDAMFLAAVTAMQLALYEIYRRARDREPVSSRLVFYFWTMMAVGVVIKGISPLIAGLTLLGLCIFDRQITWLKTLRFQWGMPWLLLLTAAWLVPFSLASGHNFLWDMIRGDVLPKLAGNQQSHGMPPGFFTFIFTAAFWPGSLFIIPALIWAWRHRENTQVRFLLGWILPVWIFFECIRTKLPEYVLPAYPAIAILTALWIQAREKIQLNRWQRALIIAQQFLWILFGLALIGACFFLGGYMRWAVPVMIAGMIVLLIIFYYPSMRRFTIITIIAAIFGVFPLWQWALPNLTPLRLSERISKKLEQEFLGKVNDQRPLLAADYQEPSLIFYLGARRARMVSLFDVVKITASSPSFSYTADQALWSPLFCSFVPRNAYWRSFFPVDQETFIHPDSLVLISQSHLLCLNQLSQENGFSWRSLDRISGLQYNRGQKISLAFVSLYPREKEK